MPGTPDLLAEFDSGASDSDNITRFNNAGGHELGFRVDLSEIQVGLTKLRERLAAGSPPVMPHPVFMRESCAACHAGPSARAEIRCTHETRTNCRQCHLESTGAAAGALLHYNQ